jgi:methionine-rich copper-binding protein CopC
MRTIGHRVASTLATVLLVALAATAGTRPAAAMSLMEQTPHINEIMEGSAVAFALRFDRPIDHERSSLTLISRGGSKVLRVRLNAQPNTLYSALGRLDPGAYELRWKARANDGEMLAGGFSFTVR